MLIVIFFFCFDKYGETSKELYARRQSYWLKHNRPPIRPFNFGNTAHYPIGSRIIDQANAPDVVYRCTPVYTPEIRRALSVAVATAVNIRAQKQMVDVCASGCQVSDIQSFRFEVAILYYINTVSVSIFPCQLKDFNEQVIVRM